MRDGIVVSHYAKFAQTRPIALNFGIHVVKLGKERLAAIHAATHPGATLSGPNS